ncbi:2Fe-2S iron-sulfur cluster-binding protein [Streptomyces sp. NBC_01426]|uniref:(2Fe-2S)-binding protein n=1 Tax=Streptomyces sp. NBC_01426 TaxID=2975866 RepID=UPI002E344C46|nr:2Fe-2S iron-sulfur cluster-binding protein [Streptomyces sp. NBC_01426]
MSENENVSGTTGGAGHAPAGWGWEPVPHGGEMDSDATAFVKLPQEMLDALDNREPLAAPGHGYVPPPMIVPLGSGSADPSATGTWTMPVQWPEAGTGAAGQDGSVQGSAPGSAAGQAPARGPIPASIPLPASVAAVFGATGQDQAQADPAETPVNPDPSDTAEWRFPDATRPGDGRDTGQWTLPGGAPAGDWSQAPATLPGGAAAPWATPAYDASLSSGVLPGAFQGEDEGAARHATGPVGGPPGRGPRVLGGPGVGTPLPDPEPVNHPTPDIDAAHGPARTPVEGERPRPAGTEAGPGDGHGFTRTDRPAAEPEPTDGRGFAVDSGGYATDGRGFAVDAGGYATDGRGFAVDDRAGFGTDGRGFAVDRDGLATDGRGFAVERDGFATDGRGFETDGQGFATDGRGFAVVGPEPEPGVGRVDAPAGPEATDGHGLVFVEPEQEPADGPAEATAPDVPVEGAADSADALPDAGDPAGVPLAETTYEEENAGAVAHHEHPLASYVLRVNGADRPVTGAWIGESLLYVLRERLGLAGAKDGCSQGECGACAVQVDGRLVASCLVPAATAASSEVRTVEGLATDGELSDVQEALCRSGGVQCGFCIPGMAMTIHDLLEGNHAPSELETRQALCGNLCRCSGYKGVIEAVREVVSEREATAAGDSGTGTGTEPRIPHQAPPGEGGIHPNGGTA